MHWADVPSLRLLEFLAQEMGDSRLLIVGTYRETDLSRRHRLSDTLGALARVPHVLRLHLSGLSAEDVRRFVATAAGMVPPAWLTTAIHGQTEGNPLFVREVVRFLADQGHFAASGTVAPPPPAIRLPEGVREVIGRRLNLLSRPCNDVLAVAAVIGREFTLDVLLRATPDQAEDAVLEALDEALAARIIEETSPGRYQFTHALVRVTLYDELRTGQRRRLHHAVGEAVEAVHRRDLDPVLADLAHHFRATGMSADTERAVDYATRAGQRADAAFAFEDAIGFFQNALDMLDNEGEDEPERRCRLLLMVGNAQRRASNHAPAVANLRAAAEIARAQDMWLLFAEVALAHADAAWRDDMQVDARSGPMLEEAVAGLSDTEAGLRSQLLGWLARDRLHTGSLDDAKALAMHAIAVARVSGDPAALATSLAGIADFPWFPDETERLLVAAMEMVEMAERAGMLEVVVRGHLRRAALLLELGDTRSTIAAIEGMSRANARIRQQIFHLFELGLKVTMALMRGAFAEAEQLILRTQAQMPSKAHSNDPVSVQIFTLRREQGRLRDMAPLVAMFMRQSAVVETWQPGLALLLVELGDLAAARTVFERLATDDFAAVPRDARWVASLVYLAEVCVALADEARAAVLYELLFPWDGRNLVMGGGTGFWGASGRFRGLLASVMGRWVAAERHFTEALALNERTGAQVQLAHTHNDHAVMLLTRGYPGDRERAASHLEAAENLSSTLGLIALAARIADWRQSLAEAAPVAVTPDNLTVRELEVLRLLAIGRGNADIALVLEISQSTVASHVHNILGKTGCANRTEAAAYAVRHRLHAG
jgi:DNA-binding CsgD family transcriptional regulator/tetratricopeptide (TPR) repeat protein